MFGWLFFWRKKPAAIIAPPPVPTYSVRERFYSSPAVKRQKPYPRYPIRREVVRPTKYRDDDDSVLPFVSGLALGSILSSSDRGVSRDDNDSFSGGGGGYSGAGASGSWDNDSSSSSSDTGSSGGGDSSSSSSSSDS